MFHSEIYLVMNNVMREAVLIMLRRGLFLYFILFLAVRSYTWAVFFCWADPFMDCVINGTFLSWVRKQQPRWNNHI